MTRTGKNLPKRLTLLAAAGCCAILLAPLSDVALGSDRQNSPRPESWAQPLEVEGVRNLFKVSDDLYRSAQPKAEGMENLESLGVKTIFSVRMFHSNRRRLEESGLANERIPMKPWRTN